MKVEPTRQYLARPLKKKGFMEILPDWFLMKKENRDNYKIERLATFDEFVNALFRIDDYAIELQDGIYIAYREKSCDRVLYQRTDNLTLPLIEEISSFTEPIIDEENVLNWNIHFLLNGIEYYVPFRYHSNSPWKMHRRDMHVYKAYDCVECSFCKENCTENEMPFGCEFLDFDQLVSSIYLQITNHPSFSKLLLSEHFSHLSFH